MGAVYRVRHTEIPGPELALKLIRPGQESQQILSRFRAEQRLLRRLQHPNIARILDANTSAQGIPFFVMELVEGQPLTAYCTTHQLDIPARLQLLITTCEAVHYAHLRGVLHRDLKPSNILITAQGFPKIIDFGLAKAIGGDGDFSTVTQLGTILGTFQYMSPEQAKPTDAAITEAADIFSLGAILYELLAGHPPLTSESLRHLPYPAILERVLQEVPPPPTTDFPALNDITLRALHKDPAARYANAAELAQCLSHCLSRGAST
ncbi:serine/threonine-protein kinase, partial [Nostoc sp. NIES-2111]